MIGGGCDGCDGCGRTPAAGSLAWPGGRDRPWPRNSITQFPKVTLPAVVDNHWMAIVEVVFRNLVATQRPRTIHRS